MTLIYERENLRVVDPSNGRYATWKTANREEGGVYFVLHDNDGTPVLGTEVTIERVGKPESPGLVSLVRVSLKKTWVPTGRPEKPKYFQTDDPNIGYLVSFIRTRESGLAAGHRAPKFEFSDIRAREAI
jgi:hypothetical protein